MDLSRSGVFRDHGATTLFRKEPGEVRISWSEPSSRVRLSTTDIRRSAGGPSYRYSCHLEIEELLGALMAIPTNRLAQIIENMESLNPPALASTIGALVRGVAARAPLPATDEDD